MLSQFFCAKIALFSALGYCSALAGPLWIDRKLTSHVRYGMRVFPHGKIWWWFTPITLILPYAGLRYFTSVAMLYAASIAPLVIVGGLASIAFPPERPNMGFVVVACGFCLVILATVGCHLAADFSYVGNTSIARDLRLERLKATIAYWQMISVYASAGYLAFGIAWLYAMWFTVDKIVNSVADKFLLGQFEVGIGILLTMCVVFGPLLEAFGNAFHAMSELIKLGP